MRQITLQNSHHSLITQVFFMSNKGRKAVIYMLTNQLIIYCVYHMLFQQEEVLSPFRNENSSWKDLGPEHRKNNIHISR